MENTTDKSSSQQQTHVKEALRSAQASLSRPLLVVINDQGSQYIETGPSPNEGITIQAVAEPTRKRRGEASEAAFLARATHLGFRVGIPWGDSERYDSVVNGGRGFLRIQVKSATRYAETRYRVGTRGFGPAVYTPDEIDFLVGYIVPENIWYIIPIEAIGQRKGIRFYPHTRRKSRALFEKYREAWCLLACDKKARGWKDIPALCRCKDLPLRCAVCPNRP